MALGVTAVAALLTWTAGVAAAQKAVLNRCAGGARPTGSCPLNTDPFGVGNIPTGCNGQVAPGLRIIVGDTGALQIHREGSGQLFGGCEIPPSTALLNGVYLAAGPDVYGVLHDQAPLIVGSNAGLKAAWTPVSQAVVGGDGSAASPFHSNTRLAGGGYSASVDVVYETPSDDVAITLTVSPPAGSNACVKLYHVLDTRLGGTDTGPALVHPSSSDPEIVGVQSSSPSVNEAFVEANPQWDHFHSGDVRTMFASVLRGADLGDVNDIDPDTDNGIGVQWELCPTTAGASLSVVYTLRFTTRLGGPAGGPGCTASGATRWLPVAMLGLGAFLLLRRRRRRLSDG